MVLFLAMTHLNIEIKARHNDPDFVREYLKKKQEIYFIGNVKFHIDDVVGLGSFMEIEASNMHDEISRDRLQEQCDFYIGEFGIKDEDLIAFSYSDMLLGKDDVIGVELF